MPSSLTTRMQQPSSDPVLNLQTLEHLARLDPHGRSQLLQRVLAAFDTSSQRLMPMWESACKSGDVAVLHHVAHTLKSSSASIGALRLSEICAEIEAGLRGQSIEEKGCIHGLGSSDLGVLSQRLVDEWQSVLTAIPQFLADWVRSQS